MPRRLKELETLEKVMEEVDKLTVFRGLEGVMKEIVRIRLPVGMSSVKKGRGKSQRSMGIRRVRPQEAPKDSSDKGD